MHRPGNGPIEYLESEVDFVGLDGDRRGNAEDAEAAANDAGHHAELEAFAGNTLGELGIGRLGPAVLHQVEAEQQPAAAHVADTIVALLEDEQAGLESFAEAVGAFRQLVAQDDLDDLEP